MSPQTQTEEAPRRLGGGMGAAAGPLLIAAALAAFQIASLDRYGLTSDEPALFYAGDRTLFWMLNPGVPHGLDFMGEEPAGFRTTFDRFPGFEDPIHYPVLPGLVAAAASAVFHDLLGWVDPVEGHHLGLVLLNALALLLFGLYACALLGRRAGLAAAAALALFPSAFGHAVNNAKDWPCAQFYGLAVLAAGLGVQRARARHLLAAGVLLGVSLSAKLNAAFVGPTLALWAPVAWALLYRRRRPLPWRVIAGSIGMFPLAALVFFVAWPWLWHGRPLLWWLHLREYLRFLIEYGVSERATWSDYPLRCLLFMSPPLVLAAALLHLGTGWRRGREEAATWALLGIWLALPIARIAAPGSFFYDANRHFLEYVPALCALAGAGAAAASEGLARWLSRRWQALASPRLARAGGWAAAAAAVAALAWPIAEYHPYQTAYFSSLVGGLGGAQRRALLNVRPPASAKAHGAEGDYWFSSARDAGRTLARLARPGDTVSACGGAHAPRSNAPPGFAGRFVEWNEPEYHEGPYVLAWPRETACWWREVREFEAERPIIERVERGGGLIYEILGPKDGSYREPVSPPTAYERDPWPTDTVGKRRATAEFVADGRRVVKRVLPGGIVVYDVVHPDTGKVQWSMPDP